MDLSQKISLKYLYNLKMFGVEYIDLDELESKIDISLENLPYDLEALKRVVLSCKKCQLAKSRKNIVFGEGSLSAKVLFIGEAPGAVEDNTGRPFVGRSGQLLRELIHSNLKLNQSDFFIANIIKCRPPKNRVPTLMEATTCKPYLDRQIEIINPKVIVALGSTSFHHLTQKQLPISKVRGEIFEFENRVLIPTFHPSFLLRNPNATESVKSDLKKIASFI